MLFLTNEIAGLVVFYRWSVIFIFVHRNSHKVVFCGSKDQSEEEWRYFQPMKLQDWLYLADDLKSSFPSIQSLINSYFVDKKTIRGRMTLFSTNKIAGLVVFYWWSVIFIFVHRNSHKVVFCGSKDQSEEGWRYFQPMELQDLSYFSDDR